MVSLAENLHFLDEREKVDKVCSVLLRKKILTPGSKASEYFHRAKSLRILKISFPRDQDINMIYSSEICQFINLTSIDHDQMAIKPDLLIT